MDQQFLTPEEINQLKELDSQFHSLKDKIGDNEVQIMNLLLSKDKLKEELILIQSNEIKIAKELEAKYGEGSISLETGEFLPSKQVS